MSRALRRAAMRRMEATAAKAPPVQPILTIPARTLAGTRYVPTLTLGPSTKAWPGSEERAGLLAETSWTHYPVLT